MDGTAHGFTCIRNQFTLLSSLHHQSLYSASFPSVMGVVSVEPNEAAHISRFFTCVLPDIWPSSQFPCSDLYQCCTYP